MGILPKAKNLAEKYKQLSGEDPAFKGASLVVVGLGALLVIGPVVGGFFDAVGVWTQVFNGYTCTPGPILGVVDGVVVQAPEVCVPNYVWIFTITIVTNPITNFLGLVIGL